MHACVLKPNDGVVDPILDKPPQVVGERKVEEILQNQLPLVENPSLPSTMWVIDITRVCKF